MGQVNRHGRIWHAKRLALGLVMLSLASTLVAGSYLMMRPVRTSPSAAKSFPPANPFLWTVDIPSPLFRLPLDAQESLFVRMSCKLDTQEDPSECYGVVEYGIGTEASRIGEWLGKQHFGNTEHALWIANQYWRPLFRIPSEGIVAKLNNGSIPDELKKAFEANETPLSPQAGVEKDDKGWWILDCGKVYILRQVDGVLSIYGESGRKGDPHLAEELIPVNLADGSFQVALPSDARPKGCYVMRLRRQVDSSGSERTQQVETARLKWLSGAGWQTTMEARYVRGSEGNPSVLQVRSKALSELSSGTNWWVVAWFNAEAPLNEQLVIVGVLAGQFVNRDGTIRLKAGEAACIRLRHTAPSRKVEYIQPAELRLQGDQWMLRWDAAVASGYRLLMVQLYAVPSPLPVLANSLEEWSKLSRGAITLDASWYWAPQKPAYYPDF